MAALISLRASATSRQSRAMVRAVTSDSFELDGSPRFIEVKTTRDGCETDFSMSSNGVEVSLRHPTSYRLYRLYEFDSSTGAGKYYVRSGPFG